MSSNSLGRAKLTELTDVNMSTYVAMYCITLVPRDLKFGMHTQLYPGCNLSNVRHQGKNVGTSGTPPPPPPKKKKKKKN